MCEVWKEATGWPDFAHCHPGTDSKSARLPGSLLSDLGVSTQSRQDVQIT